MLNLIFLLITFSFFNCNPGPLKPLVSIKKPIAGIKPESQVAPSPTQPIINPIENSSSTPITPVTSPKPELTTSTSPAVLPAPEALVPEEQKTTQPLPTTPTTQQEKSIQPTSTPAESLAMKTPDFKIESVVVNEDLLEKSNTSSEKISAILEKANSQNKEISEQYKKSDTDAIASIDQIDKKLGEFNQISRDIKSYLASQKSGSDKEVDEKVRILGISLQEFNQDYNNLKALRKEVESAQKDLVLQNSDKTAAIFKIYGFQNSLDSIKADFLKLESETPDKIEQSLKQMDEFCQDAEKQLTILQTIGSSFKGKADILSGKINQATESLKILSPKKDELSKKLKLILDLKEKGATIKEAELLGKIESSGIYKKKRKSSKMPEIILNKKEKGLNENLEYVEIDEKAITISFIQKISNGFFGFTEQLLKFIKKLFGAIILNKRSSEPLTPETKLSLPQTMPGVIPVTSAISTPPNTQPTTQISLTTTPTPLATAPVPTMSLSLTTTPTTKNAQPENKPEDKKSEEIDFFKILTEAFGHIILGLKKIALLLYHYISEVYRNLASTQP